MLDTSKLDKYASAKKAVFMAVNTRLHVDFFKEQKIPDPQAYSQLAMSMQLAKFFTEAAGSEDVDIKNLKYEIKNMTSKAIDTVFNELFKEDGAPDAIDPISRH